MSINGKQKGKRGEREFAKLCREQGYVEARRGQQYNGLDGEDVVGLPSIHIEVKRTERLNIDDAITQSKSDCKPNQLPIVAHRKNNKHWLITMDVDDWFKIYNVYRKVIEQE